MKHTYSFTLNLRSDLGIPKARLRHIACRVLQAGVGDGSVSAIVCGHGKRIAAWEFDSVLYPFTANKKHPLVFTEKEFR